MQKPRVEWRPHRNDGFTLVEVMVALAIAAISLASVAAAVSQMADAAHAMQQRTYASWIAQNRITEMRLANAVPDVSESSGEESFAGQEWTWRATVSETGVENLFRVDVAVSVTGEENAIRTVTGFIGEPVIPGQGNATWGLGAPAQGDEK